MDIEELETGNDDSKQERCQLYRDILFFELIKTFGIWHLYTYNNTII